MTKEIAVREERLPDTVDEAALDSRERQALEAFRFAGWLAARAPSIGFSGGLAIVLAALATTYGLSAGAAAGVGAMAAAFGMLVDRGIRKIGVPFVDYLGVLVEEKRQAVEERRESRLVLKAAEEEATGIEREAAELRERAKRDADAIVEAANQEERAARERLRDIEENTRRAEFRLAEQRHAVALLEDRRRSAEAEVENLRESGTARAKKAERELLEAEESVNDLRGQLAQLSTRYDEQVRLRLRAENELAKADPAARADPLTALKLKMTGNEEPTT